MRDLLQESDDGINQALLEAEDLNNEQIIDPLDPNRIILIATSEAMDHTINQINRARTDLGLVGGAGSELTGPCMGQAWSYDSDGQPLDVAWDWDQDGPPIGFKEGPFIVDVDGAVIYTGENDGTSGAVPNGLPFFCIGSGFVEFQGGIPLTAPGVALVFLSTVGMLFNARPARTWGGV